MADAPEQRADKYLWSVRIFKTRSMATDACKKGRVLIENIPVKPSRSIKKGDIIIVKKPPLNYRIRVTAFPKNRVSAKLVQQYFDDITPEEELQKLKLSDSFFIKRDRGAGRPTKKERRLIDKLREK